MTILAVTLALPSLWAGLAVDDFAHRRMVQDHSRSPLELYGFLKGDVAENHRLMEDGFLPWWTLANLRIAFFRPISSLLLWFDYAVLGDRVMLMHAQTIVWFAATVFVTSLFYRRVGGAAWPAAVSALLFAVDDAHAISISWLACRHALLSFGFGALTLVAFDAWRREGRRWGAVVAPLGLAASLCCGESGVATVAYIFAYVTLLDSAPWRHRLVSLAPVVGVLVLWRAAYAMFGYGTSGSGYYTDPAVEPLSFLGQVLLRGPILLLGQWVLPSVDFLSAATDAQTVTVSVIAALVIGGLAVFLIPVIRRDRIAAFWTVGMLLSIPSSCATVPSDRLLWFVGLGAFGLMSRVIGPLWNALASGPRRAAGRALIVLGVVVHAMIAPITLPMRTRRLLPPPIAAQVRVKLPRDPVITEQTLVILNGPSMLNAVYVGAENELAGRPAPRGVRIVGPSMSAVTVSRVDDNSLSLDVEDGYLVYPLDLVYRSPKRTFTPGEQIELSDMSVSITRVTADGRPAEVQFRFDRSLDDQTLRFIRWENGAYDTIAPPDVGESIFLPTVRIDPFGS